MAICAQRRHNGTEGGKTTHVDARKASSTSHAHRVASLTLSTQPSRPQHSACAIQPPLELATTPCNTLDSQQLHSCCFMYVLSLAMPSSGVSLVGTAVAMQGWSVIAAWPGVDTVVEVPRLDLPRLQGSVMCAGRPCHGHVHPSRLFLLAFVDCTSAMRLGCGASVDASWAIWSMYSCHGR